jgi:DNA-binding response OmpR family regulator
MIKINFSNNLKNKDIPVIFLTAMINSEDIVKGFRNGGVDYITKPFNKEELICRVNTHLELKIAREIIQSQAEELRKTNRFVLGTLYQYGKYVSQDNLTENKQHKKSQTIINKVVFFIKTFLKVNSNGG